MAPKKPNVTMVISEKPPEVTKDWEKVLYTPERVMKWMKGEITLQDLNAISGPEMLEMAIIGFSMYEQGKFNEAQTIFMGLSELDPTEGYYRTALGAVYLAQEDLEAAEVCFNQAIKINPRELASLVNRGEVYLRQGKIAEAANDFKRAVELDPKGEDPLSHRARVLAGAALEMIQQANAPEAKPAAKPAAVPAKPAAKAAAKPAAKPAAAAASKKK